MSKVSAAVAAKLSGDFIGGAEPSAEDVKMFNELLGEGNTHLHRWVKQMASFTDAERKQWKPAAEDKNALRVSVSDSDKPAAPKKLPKQPVTTKITCKSGADVAELEKMIRTIQVDGLDFGTFKKEGSSVLVWKCARDAGKVSNQDLLDMTEGFKAYVEKAEIQA